ncbi:MAG: TetR/AcrR family transcriptional regulator [Lachnospiraceae bacterium]|nr:TetR/AcrR family transcriptional regulator [Lachnospiraceae bacterium]
MKQKTETMLCLAFMELLRKYPFPKITIQKIASQCGVNRQTFYYHFDNIYDLMTKAFEYELIHESHMYEEKSWEAAMKKFLWWMQNNRVIIKNILSNVETCYLRQAIYPIIEKSMSSEYIPNQIIKANGDANEDFVRHFLILGITQYVLEWAENDFKETVDEIIRQIFFILRKVYN